MSAAWPSALEHRFYDGHDRKVEGLTPTLATLLHPWIKCFEITIPACWNLTSSKPKKSEAKLNRKIRKQRQSSSASVDSRYVERLRRFLIRGG